MILNVQNTKGRRVSVHDEMGMKIGTCFRYNTRTRVAHLYVIAGRQGKSGTRLLVNRKRVVKIAVKLPKSYVLVDGVRY